ncbi:MAG: hypothetical protein WC223_13715 [Bacteroidales bacterium]|jgi:hypothetical protein
MDKQKLFTWKMRKANSHISKTKPEKDYYTKYIKTQDYEPTVDETLKFSETDDDKKDFSNQKSKKKRKPKLQQQIYEHFEENWIKWASGLIIALLVWLMFDSKLSISGINYKVDRIQDDVKELKQTDKETNQHIQQQDLNIKENQIKIENLEKNNSTSKMLITKKQN